MSTLTIYVKPDEDIFGACDRFCVLCDAAGSLQIRRSQESDEGKYECIAENSVGVAYSYGANLYVRGTTSAF